MKAIYAILLLICPVLAWAQSTGGPDTYGYTWKDSNNATGPTYSWIDITTTGTQVTGLADDNTVGPFTMYGFQYYTASPTQFWIGSNGYISFNNVNISSSGSMFPVIPTTAAPNGYMAAYNTDLSFAGNANPGTCYRYEDGLKLIVSFINVPFWDSSMPNSYGGSNSFQIVLDKTDNSITYQYKTQSGQANSTYTSNFIVIGIENATGSSGLQHSRGSTYPAINKAIKFYYPSTAGTVTDAGINWNMNANNASNFVSSGGASVPLMANVKNFGNQSISNFSVAYQVSDQFGTNYATGTQSVSFLGAGMDMTLNFSTPLVTVAPGEYRFRTIVSGVTGDNITSNDTAIYQFNVVNTSTASVYLDYSDQAPNGTGLGWAGGDGGVGIYIEPPFYPAYIQSSRFNISANSTTTPAGFHAMIYDDNGPNGSHGTLLDSVFRPAAQVTTGAYNIVPASTPNIPIFSGGVYLLWLMDGESINLARDTDRPVSRRTFEVLQGTWASYRDGNTQDFLLGINVTSTTTGNRAENVLQGKVYPNPVKDICTLQFEKNVNPATMEVKVFDMGGKEVAVKALRYADKVVLHRGSEVTGEYVYRVTWSDSNDVVTGKLIFD